MNKFSISKEATNSLCNSYYIYIYIVYGIRDIFKAGDKGVGAVQGIIICSKMWDATNDYTLDRLTPLSPALW